MGLPKRPNHLLFPKSDSKSGSIVSETGKAGTVVQNEQPLEPGKSRRIVRRAHRERRPVRLFYRAYLRWIYALSFGSSVFFASVLGIGVIWSPTRPNSSFTGFAVSLSIALLFSVYLTYSLGRAKAFSSVVILRDWIRVRIRKREFDLHYAEISRIEFNSRIFFPAEYRFVMRNGEVHSFSSDLERSTLLVETVGRENPSALSDRHYEGFRKILLFQSSRADRVEASLRSWPKLLVHYCVIPAVMGGLAWLVGKGSAGTCFLLLKANLQMGMIHAIAEEFAHSYRFKKNPSRYIHLHLHRKTWVRFGKLLRLSILVAVFLFGVLGRSFHF